MVKRVKNTNSALSETKITETTPSLAECQQELQTDIDNALFYGRHWPYSTFVTDSEQFVQYLPASLEVLPYHKTGGSAERIFLRAQVQKLTALAHELSFAFAHSEGYGNEFRPDCYVNPHQEVMTQSFRLCVQEFLLLYERYALQMPQRVRQELQEEVAESVAIWLHHNFEQEWMRAQQDSFYGDAQYYHRTATLEYKAFPVGFMWAIDAAYRQHYGHSFAVFLTQLNP